MAGMRAFRLVDTSDGKRAVLTDNSMAESKVAKTVEWMVDKLVLNSVDVTEHLTAGSWGSELVDMKVVVSDT